LAQKEIAELKNQLHQTKEKMTRERAKRSSAEGKKKIPRMMKSIQTIIQGQVVQVEIEPKSAMIRAEQVISRTHQRAHQILDMDASQPP
jgi:hypothetical protein